MYLNRRKVKDKRKVTYLSEDDTAKLNEIKSKIRGMDLSVSDATLLRALVMNKVEKILSGEQNIADIVNLSDH